MAGHQQAARSSGPGVYAVALGYGLIFWLCYFGYGLHLGVIGNDFDVFHRAAGEPIATVYALREHGPFAYPPTALLWLRPLSALAWPSAFALWTALSFGGLAWGSARLCDSRIVFLVLASPVLATTIAIGQFGALVGALLLLAVSLKGWRQGALLALAGTIKPHLLVAAPVILLVRRDWSALAGGAAATAALVLAQLLLFGPHLWIEWLAALRAFPDAVERVNAYAASVSPAGVASHLGLPAWPFLAVGVLLAAAIIRKRAGRAEDDELAALILIASALVSPYLLVYDLPAAMPFVVRRMLASAGRVRTAALATFLAPFAGLAMIWLVVSLVWRGRSRRYGSAEATGTA